MAFAGQQARGRVQTDPACAWQEHLAPGVQIGEVFLRAARAIDRFHVGLQLDQVAGHEARRQAHVAQDLHQQPAAVPAGTTLDLQRFLWRLHAGLHADGVRNVALQPLVDVNQKVDRAALAAVHLVHIGLQQRRHGCGGEVGRQLLDLTRVVLERVVFCRRFQEKVERVVHRHLHHQVDGDLEFGGGLGEHQARLVVGKRVLLPVDEVVAGLDALRIREHLGAAVRRGTQTNHLWPQFDKTVVPIMRDVAQGNVDGHAMLSTGRNKKRWVRRQGESWRGLQAS